MSKGKTVSQGSHASVNAVQNSDENAVNTWLDEYAGTKITLAVESKEQLLSLLEEADTKNIPTGYVEDLGRTEIDSGTLTAGAIGPYETEVIDEITGNLSLF